MPDYILSGQAHGDVATRLMNNNFDPNCLRPWIGQDGRTYLTTMQNGKPVVNLVTNVSATLRKDEWILLDQVIIKAAKARLRAVADLRSAGLQFVIPNGMGKTVLEFEKQSDISPADVSMDGIKEADSDRPLYDLTSLPLPIIHKDFQFSARQLATSRNGNTPLDTTMAELSARRVAEEAEKLLLGESASFAYGGGTVFGYTNFPDRLTKVLTAPTTANHAVTLAEILQMRTQSTDAFHYGPWILYNSNAWDEFLDEDFSSLKGDNTFRERILSLDGISDVRTLDFLSGTQLILVQQTSDVARMVIGMDITTLQWESQGGMQLNFKVMAILVPQLRSDFNSNTGIVHGTV